MFNPGGFQTRGLAQGQDKYWKHENTKLCYTFEFGNFFLNFAFLNENLYTHFVIPFWSQTVITVHLIHKNKQRLHTVLYVSAGSQGKKVGNQIFF